MQNPPPKTAQEVRDHFSEKTHHVKLKSSHPVTRVQNTLESLERGELFHKANTCEPTAQEMEMTHE